VYPDATTGGSSYRYRDDALITLGHARGLVDVGTVSVGAAGSRVEGYSAPVQFAVASGFYGLGGDGYRALLDAQVALSTLVLGASILVVLRVAAPRRCPPAVAVTATMLGILLFATYGFFGWHSSGMENSITNALVMTAVAVLALAIPRPRLLPVAGIVVALFSMSRAEFVFHAAPLLAVAGGFVVGAAPAGQRVKRVVLLVVPAVALWVVVQSLRLWYFGSITPNTAEAQGISPGDNALRWAAVLWPLLLPLAYVGLQALRRRRIVGAGLANTAAIGIVAAVFLGNRAHVDDPLPGVDAFLHASRVLGWWWWLALVAALALVVWSRPGVVESLLASLVVTGFAHLLVFGPARLAAERVVTFVLVPMAVLAAVLALRIEPERIMPGVPNAATAMRLVLAGILLVVAVGGAWSREERLTRQENLCCDVSEVANRILAEASEVRDDTGLPTVTIANPDLGLVSLDKSVNISDVGLLGDPLLARVWPRSNETGRLDVGVDYLNHYAAPDVVELHGVWSCYYAPWWRSPDFEGAYEQVWDDGWTTEWAIEGCPQEANVPGGIWVRTDRPANEVRLSNQLADDPSPAGVRNALAECESADPTSCQHVTRAVYRNLEQFANEGTLEETIDLFADLPSAAYDQAVLNSRSEGEWYAPAEAYLFESR
jgi:hypothetical protein